MSVSPILASAWRAGADEVRINRWHAAEEALRCVRRHLDAPGLEEARVDQLSDHEWAAMDRIICLPTANLAHAVRKIELAGELDRSVLPFIAELRSLAGITTDKLAPPLKPHTAKEQIA